METRTGWQAGSNEAGSNEAGSGRPPLSLAHRTVGHRQIPTKRASHAKERIKRNQLGICVQYQLMEIPDLWDGNRNRKRVFQLVRYAERCATLFTGVIVDVKHRLGEFRCLELPLGVQYCLPLPLIRSSLGLYGIETGRAHAVAAEEGIGPCRFLSLINSVRVRPERDLKRRTRI